MIFTESCLLSFRFVANCCLSCWLESSLALLPAEQGVIILLFFFFAFFRRVEVSASHASLPSRMTRAPHSPRICLAARLKNSNNKKKKTVTTTSCSVGYWRCFGKGASCTYLQQRQVSIQFFLYLSVMWSSAFKRFVTE